MEGNQKWIYLMSSNTNEEYMVDTMEALSLPYGSVLHFRYQLRWLDPDIRKCLLQKGEGLKGNLKDSIVVVCYLYQEKRENEYEWKAIYPIRTAILVDAYRTGDEDWNIAHFYFKLTNYISYNGNDFTTEKMRERIGDQFGQAYAVYGFPLEEKEMVKEKEKSAFFQLCNSINFNHFKTPEGSFYVPLFCYIEGLRDQEGKLIQPSYDPSSRKSYYKLKEGSRYLFEFAPYFPLSFLKQSFRYPMFTLSCDKRIFSTPEKYRLKVASRYNEESWYIIPSLLEKDLWTNISFKTEEADKVEEGAKNFLHLDINIPVRVTRNMLYRRFNLAADIFFSLGTISLAFAKSLPQWSWWYFPVGFFYFLWVIFKLIYQFWRG